MTFIDTYKTFSKIDVNEKKYIYFDLNKLANHFKFSLSLLPFSIKILLENLIRNEDGKLITADMINSLCSQLSNKDKSFEIAFSPTRVLMQDFTGVPAVADLAAMRDALKAKNIDPNKINPLSRVDLVIDHSVMVDEFGNAAAYDKNVKKEFTRNTERYEFLKWGQNTFDNFFLVPPGAGICHQVNLENIAKTIWVSKTKDGDILYPDSVVGTDSHTTMVNALSVLGWGVGGIEAEAAMLGQPISMNIPKVLGFNMFGSLNEGITATDLVLTITEKLRHHGVVGKFVEFIGKGLKNLTLADRATISNMAPEYGATCGFFPTDSETINYLRLTGKDDHHLTVVEAYTKKQQLWYDGKNPQEYDELITFDLNEVKTSIAGPKRPQDKILLQDVPESFGSIISKRFNGSREAKQLESGDIVIAAITSCTNTSNPNVMIAAGLVAKKAVEFGLTVKPWVKTSLAPGSKVVSDYLEKSNLSTYLDAIGFNLVGYGCTTCIGNSGSLNEWISTQIKEKKLSVCSVLSGNRNFEGRIHQEIKANYLASPPLVVAFALAGSIYVNIQSDVIGISKDGKEVLLKDLWPTAKEIESVLQTSLSSDMFLSRYKEIYKGDNNWTAIKTIKKNTYEWSDISTYVKQPPFFNDARTQEKQNIKDARILALLGDSVTTDHISPAGAIREDSPAGYYLSERQISKQNFNSYGSRRGNHEIMIRGTFANIRIRNEIVTNTEGGITRCFVNGKDMSIYEAAMEYEAKEIPLIVIAGKEYGTGSSRDWAAKGTRLLGVRAVIAESFERIHRSNLIGMGVLPFEFINGKNRKSLELDGSEKLTILNVDKIVPSKIIQCKISSETKNYYISLKCRIDTFKELDYYKAGGILQYVLNSKIEKNS
ncbi:MAG: aconitate hydratase AcnA [Pelagibacteraceae bacterium]|jgi:aconitate hydratase|nr:aconitate hydratase AcnA [Pelagibacteraceae bacterium]HJL58456.1 aconitate hydratase AcnA [Alphaproteobacteria bacterium]MBO6466709.1 aconitate hydratase AcnA [Pelagibacteraceae bacterium]MBO6467977.1 aconitate hydratase AcnA [Pelagibacteraceae bacterium]MBO6469776.1 aconitate hydratase AcnA [Pelagibacteraceae bacterium]